MNSGPTPIAPGCAGTPLSHQATASNRNATLRPGLPRTPKDESISDTLETTDREPEGHQTIETDLPQSENDAHHNGDLLDLSG